MNTQSMHVGMYDCMRSESESDLGNQHTSNTQNTGKYMSSNDRKSTLSLKHSISVLSHEKHTHSPKR